MQWATYEAASSLSSCCCVRDWNHGCAFADQRPDLLHRSRSVRPKPEHVKMTGGFHGRRHGYATPPSSAARNSSAASVARVTAVLVRNDEHGLLYLWGRRWGWGDWVAGRGYRVARRGNCVAGRGYRFARRGYWVAGRSYRIAGRWDRIAGRGNWVARRLRIPRRKD